MRLVRQPTGCLTSPMKEHVVFPKGVPKRYYMRLIISHFREE